MFGKIVVKTMKHRLSILLQDEEICMIYVIITFFS